MSKKWKKFDLSQSKPKHFNEQICNTCFYAMEYKARYGYNYSYENQLIHNLKKEPVKKTKPDEWHHKISAITDFARAVHNLLNGKSLAITTIPTSKVKGHEKYDSRLEDMISELLQLGKGAYTYVCPIINKESIKSASTENGPRHPDTIYKNYVWKGFQDTIPPSLIVIDDVISSGGHYVAYRRLLLEHCPEIKVYGVFWAKSI